MLMGIPFGPSGAVHWDSRLALPASQAAPGKTALAAKAKLKAKKPSEEEGQEEESDDEHSDYTSGEESNSEDDGEHSDDEDEQNGEDSDADGHSDDEHESNDEFTSDDEGDHSDDEAEPDSPGSIPEVATNEVTGSLTGWRTAAASGQLQAASRSSGTILRQDKGTDGGKDEAMEEENEEEEQGGEEGEEEEEGAEEEAGGGEEETEEGGEEGGKDEAMEEEGEKEQGGEEEEGEEEEEAAGGEEEEGAEEGGEKDGAEEEEEKGDKSAALTQKQPDLNLHTNYLDGRSTLAATVPVNRQSTDLRYLVSNQVYATPKPAKPSSVVGQAVDNSLDTRPAGVQRSMPRGSPVSLVYFYQTKKRAPQAATAPR